MPPQKQIAGGTLVPDFLRLGGGFLLVLYSQYTILRRYALLTTVRCYHYSLTLSLFPLQPTVPVVKHLVVAD